MGVALSLSLSLSLGAWAQVPPPFTVTPLGPYGGYAHDLSEDGSVIVACAGEPVRVVRLSDGSYQTEFLDPARNVACVIGPRTFFPFENFRGATTSDDGAVVALAGRDIANGFRAVYRYQATLQPPLLVEDMVGPDRSHPTQAIVTGDGSQIFAVVRHVHDTNLGEVYDNDSIVLDPGPNQVAIESVGAYVVIGAVSYDGSVIVGSVADAAAIWVRHGASYSRTAIPVPAGAGASLGTTVTSDGVWVGVNNGGAPGVRGSFLWNRVTGETVPVSGTNFGAAYLFGVSDDATNAVVVNDTSSFCMYWTRGTGPVDSAFLCPRTLSGNGRFALNQGGGQIIEFVPICSNGLDDDADGLTDTADPGCASASDTSEKESTLVCDDGIDNDADGLTDFPSDAGCAASNSPRENPQCNDGIDNDADAVADLLDSDCTSATDDSEWDLVQARVIDFETIASNALVTNQFESVGVRIAGVGALSGFVIAEGDLGSQNFGNSRTQILHFGDPDEPTTIQFVNPSNPNIVVGATSFSARLGDGDLLGEDFTVTFFDLQGAVLATSQHTTAAGGIRVSETSANLGSLIGSVELRLLASSASGAAADDISYQLATTQPACSNGLDDDADGKADSADFGCTSASDTSERSASYVCDDGLDNDGDALTDFPFDPGCAHAQAKKENPACNDGVDNDSDTLIDFPADTYCTSASASAESPPANIGYVCGIGPELALAVPLVAWARRRRGRVV
jgi:hypothetical protein